MTLSKSVYCQPDTVVKAHKYHFWYATGGQFFFSENFKSLIGIQKNLNFSVYEHHFIKAKGYIGISTDFGFGNELTAQRIASVGNLSLLYGIGKYYTKSFAFVPLTGISYGSAHWRGDYAGIEHGTWLGGDRAIYKDENDYNYFGVPLEVSYILGGPHLGFDIDLYANFHRHSDYGMALNFIFGKIRD